jgi:hypothetical protein
MEYTRDITSLFNSYCKASETFTDPSKKSEVRLLPWVCFHMAPAQDPFQSRISTPALGPCQVRSRKRSLTERVGKCGGQGISEEVYARCGPASLPTQSSGTPAHQ